MGTRLNSGFLVFFGVISLNVQAQPNEPAFEVASLKVSVGRILVARPPDLSHPGRVEIHGMSLRNLILTAYEVTTYEIQGPEWLQTVHYDILATMPVGTSRDRMHAMLRSLLKEKLGVAAHFAQVPTEVYALVEAKAGLRLSEADGPEDSSPQSKMMADDLWRLSGKMSIDTLARVFSPRLDRPLVNKTGLAGVYSIVLDYAPLAARGTITSSGGEANVLQAVTPALEFGDKLFASFEKQLGLKVQRQSSGYKMLIVDHAERVPINSIK